MPIVASELKMYRSLLVSDTAGSNGGRMSTNEVITGLSNNIMPDVPQAERIAGSTKYRKVFYRVTNAADLPLLSATIFMDKYTQGDDAVYFFPGTQTDLQSAITGSEVKYGAAKLDANRSAGATSLTVLLENPSIPIFTNGDKIRVSNKPTVDAAGDEDIVTISSVPSLVGSLLTFSFTPALTFSYLETNTRVSKVYTVGDVKPTYSSQSVTSALGTCNFAQLALTNLGTIYDVWTVTFSSPTAYSVSGANSGAVGTGNRSGDFAPLNPSSGVPFFTLPSAALGGTFAASDTIHFTTSPAAVPLWVRRDVPGGAAAIVGNSFSLCMEGETA